MAEAASILPQSAGYGVVIGIGFFFALFMMGLTYLQNRYTTYKSTTSEEFNSASHSVKPGLIASGIVSAWTWAATLLQSSTVAYNGPFWYASGATVQVLLFAMIAAKLKIVAPYARTFLEIINKRWGTVAHLVFLFFALSTNIIVSAMLLLGGSAVVNELTGINTVAAIFLIPLGVVVYVIAGGMRATLLCDYSHTVVLFAIILTVVFTVYTTSPLIGSPMVMYDLLAAASEKVPVSGNAGGSYLTMRSKNGLIFGVINIIGNFGTVFNDQAYFQRSVASLPGPNTTKAYLLGGLCWFSIPFAFATTCGLAAVAVQQLGSATLTPSQVQAGLSAPTAVAVLLGKGGAGAILVLLFMAVTSATSAELIAVSSILTFDVWGTYIRPNSSEETILKVSHFCVGLWGLIMSIMALIFYEINVQLGYLYELMGTLIGSAVVPIACAICWKKTNRIGAIVGAISGLFAGIIAWLVTASCLSSGVINVATTGGDYPMLAGNLASIGVGSIITVVWSLLRPENYSFDETRAINAPIPAAESEASSIEEKGANVRISTPTPDQDLDPVILNQAFKIAKLSSIVLTLVLIIIVPLPLFFSSHVFSKGDFVAWIAVAMAWVILAACCIVFYPIWESRSSLGTIFRGIYSDVSGKKAKA